MRYFTADTHFFHQGVIEYCKRPWETYDEMAKGLIDNWNSVVSIHDTIFVLGDFAFGGRGKREHVLYALAGKKILIRGNHDGDYSQNKNAGFDHVFDELVMDLRGTRVRLSHYPYDKHDDRYPERHPVNDGNWLLHGHVHCAWAERDKQINVGVDVRGYFPISEIEVDTLIRGMK